MSLIKRIFRPERKKVEIPKEKREIKEKEEKWLEPEGELAVDVYHTDSEIVVEAPVAGVKAEELELTVEDDLIKIKGKREKPQVEDFKNYLIQECYWGAFSREIISPFEIDGSRAEASIKEGVLTIKIPKIERKKKRKIKIKEE